MINVGETLKALRKERDLSIEMVVADMNQRFPDLKINKSMLSRWENGVNDPSLDYAKALCLYYDVSLDYLIGLTEIKTASRHRKK